MANYYGSARSNYFRVKDEAAFRAWAEKRQCEVHAGDNHGGAYVDTFCILPDNRCEGTFVSYDSELDQTQPDVDNSIDILGELAEHLKPLSVAIIMESGAEKLSYIIGWAEAINSKGERHMISLTNIYADIAAWGKKHFPATIELWLKYLQPTN